MLVDPSPPILALFSTSRCWLSIPVLPRISYGAEQPGQQNNGGYNGQGY